MADLDDLGYPSISDMSTDEGIELLRQLRLSRRTPVKKNVERAIERKANAKKITDVSSAAAVELLKILGGGCWGHLIQFMKIKKMKCH